MINRNNILADYAKKKAKSSTRIRLANKPRDKARLIKRPVAAKAIIDPQLEKATAGIMIAFYMAMIHALLISLSIIKAIYGPFYQSIGTPLVYLADVVVIVSLAYGLFKKSRICAILLLLHSIMSIIWHGVLDSGYTMEVLMVVYIYCYYRGIKGVYAYHRRHHELYQSHDKGAQTSCIH